MGVLPTIEALRRAQEKGLDLIEISPNASPPVAKIMDYGRFQYVAQKKDRESRAKAHITETKTLPADYFWIALGLNAVYFILGGLFFGAMYRSARGSGRLGRLGMD